MIVDFHCHFSRSFFRFREYRMNAEALLREMDNHGVTRAVVSAAGEFAAYWNTRGNDDIAVLAQRFPERVIGFATINPWMRDEKAGNEEPNFKRLRASRYGERKRRYG